MKFLLEHFYSLTAYTRLILLGSLLLAVVCLFLSALYGYPRRRGAVSALSGSVRGTAGSLLVHPGGGMPFSHAL